VYHINKVLGVIPTEVSDYLDLILAHQNCLNQGDDFVREEGTTGQAFPGRLAKAGKNG